MKNYKTIINYEEGKGLLVQGDVQRIMMCCSQIINRIADLTGKDIDEVGEMATEGAKVMRDSGNLDVKLKGKAYKLFKEYKDRL